MTDLVQAIIQKVDADIPLTKQDAVTLLQVDNYSSEFYHLISKANELSRREYKDKGYVFTQIGINSAPCSGNCQFCSLGRDNYAVGVISEKSKNEILEQVNNAVKQGIDALFLMTTADYPLNEYLDIASSVKEVLTEDMMFIANIGDFDDAIARKLKDVGFTGVYHIVRLNEGVATAIPVENRIKTLDAIRTVGLDLIYCVEPIGPEHTYDQIADEMIRAREYNVDIMACMKRVAVPGTTLYTAGEITDLELTKIVAVTRLVVRPKKSMNVHEPKEMALLAGVNQLYAEIGVNPRDLSTESQNSRGYSIASVKKMLQQVGYKTK